MIWRWTNAPYALDRRVRINVKDVNKLDELLMFVSKKGWIHHDLLNELLDYGWIIRRDYSERYSQ